MNEEDYVVVAKSLDKLLANGIWQGNNPFKIDLVDSRNNTNHRYEVRQVSGNLTIQETNTSNPGLVLSYSLERNGESWEYIDPYQIKYSIPSPDAPAAFSRLKLALNLLEEKLRQSS